MLRKKCLKNFICLEDTSLDCNLKHMLKRDKRFSFIPFLMSKIKTTILIQAALDTSLHHQVL